MVLNFECFNAVLIYLQKTMTVNSIGQVTPIRVFTVINNIGDKFSREDIGYSIRKLLEEGYIKADAVFNQSAEITDITFAGHQYLKSL